MEDESDLLRILRLSCTLAAEVAQACPDMSGEEIYAQMKAAVREENRGSPRGMHDWAVMEWFGVDDVLA